MPALPTPIAQLWDFFGPIATGISDLAAFAAVGVFILTLISPTLAGRILGWWYRRVAIREKFEAAMAASVVTSAKERDANRTTTPTERADATTVAAPSVMPSTKHTPTYPQPQRPIPPSPHAPSASVSQIPSMPARAAAHSTRRLWGSTRYPRIWRLSLAFELLALVGYVGSFTSGNSYWLGVSGFFTLWAAASLAAWTASAAARMGNLKWAWGIGIGTLLLGFLGPLAPLPTILFTLFGPTPADGKLTPTHPWFARVALVMTGLTFAVMIMVAVTVYISAGADPNSTLGSLIGIVFIGAFAIYVLVSLVGLGLNIYAIVESLRLRRWGWAIASLLFGFFPFAFNGPTTQPTPELVGVAIQQRVHGVDTRGVDQQE